MPGSGIQHILEKLSVNEIQIIVNVVPELVLRVIFPCDWGAVVILVVMTIIATFTAIFCVVIATCG